MLGGLGLYLAGGFNVGDKGQMNEQRVFLAQIPAQLADGLDEGQPFDVADGATDLNDGHIGTTIQLQNRLLNFIGDVRDHLHRSTQVFPTTLLHDHRIVNPAGGVVVLLAHDRVGVPLVMAHIQIGFGTVVGDVHLAVLKRVHGAWIHIDIRIQLLKGDGQSS